MRRLVALSLLLPPLAAGCFYEDTINQRPSASIRQVTTGAIVRGAPLQLAADTDDPDGDPVSVSWTAYACTSGTAPSPDCDDAPFVSGTSTDFGLTVPFTRADGTPTLALRIVLQAEDANGAIAKPSQELVLSIGDGAPVLALRQVSTHHFAVDSHVSLFADVSDPDDLAADVTLAWSVFTPTGSATYDLEPLSPPDAPAGHREEAEAFVPHATGAWTVRVIATDPLGMSTTSDFALQIAADEPPCIAETSPQIDDAGDPTPLFEPTVFEVPSVTDDLDTYPPVLDDADAGAAAFTWTLATNGGARTPLSVTGDRVLLDPASFHAGDALELRVEVADRVPRQASFDACPDANASCAFDPGEPTCVQRQTWRIEVQ